jgi:type 1 glutamine amidotransferase
MKAIIPCALALGAVLLVAARRDKPPGDVPPEAAENIALALPAEPYAAPAKPRRLLVFSRTNGFRHESIPTGHLMLAQLGRRTGAFVAVASEDPGQFERPNLDSYDAVCFLNTTLEVFSPHPQELAGMDAAQKAAARAREDRLKANLMDFIRGGRGFVGIHAATDSCYQWREYGRMINGYFDGHPWTANTRVSIKVEPGRENHPLVAMFGGNSVEFREEIYQLGDPYDSGAVHMLLRLDTEKSDMNVRGIRRDDGDFGVSWARQWGDGRVFYCSLGHNHHIYWHPVVVRHYLAGIQWAIGDLKAGVSGVNH